MRILLINKSFVISELLKYALKETTHTYQENNSFKSIDDGYDLIIVDEYFFDNDIYMRYKNRPFIILSNKHSIDNFTNLDSQTVIIKKPFLPYELNEAINSFESRLKTLVLDKKEIDKIRQLLNYDEGDSDITY